jgi:preprotein translocase subunit YajC
VSPTALIFVVVIIVMFVLLARGPRRRQQVQQKMWEALEVGDEIVTAGGIYGDVTGFRGDDVLVRIAPELEVRVARRAIAGVVEAEEPKAEPEEAPPGEQRDEEPR